jgi:hypothetical protein
LIILFGKLSLLGSLMMLLGNEGVNFPQIENLKVEMETSIKEK